MLNAHDRVVEVGCSIGSSFLDFSNLIVDFGLQRRPDFVSRGRDRQINERASIRISRVEAIGGGICDSRRIPDGQFVRFTFRNFCELFEDVAVPPNEDPSIRRLVFGESETLDVQSIEKGCSVWVPVEPSTVSAIAIG